MARFIYSEFYIHKKKMTSMDKAGIAIAIGITIVAVAIAGAGTNLQSEGPGGSPFVAPPITQSTNGKRRSYGKSKIDGRCYERTT